MKVKTKAPKAKKAGKRLQAVAKPTTEAPFEGHVRLTGGNFDSHNRNIFFIAGSVRDVIAVHHLNESVLVPVNDIGTVEKAQALKPYCEDGTRVLIDSGVFSLANRYALKHHIPIGAAFARPPAQMPGFDKLYDSYVAVMDVLKDSAWGYIELDQGTTADKRATRAKLEARGLTPIPVYHPVADGWDYFDELAQNYDRICVGGIAQASIAARERIVSTIWERKRAYPHLWVHYLGLSPTLMGHTYPGESCDSTGWITGYQFGNHREYTIACIQASCRPGIVYRRNDSESLAKAVKMGAMTHEFYGRGWRLFLAEQEEIFGRK